MSKLMMIKRCSFTLLLIASILLTGCAGFGKAKKQELAPIEVTPEIQVHASWAKHINSGTKGQYLTLTPAIDKGKIYSNDFVGHVVAIDAQTGRVIWNINTKILLTSGIAIADGRLFIGSADGQVIALDAATGHLIWQSKVSNQVLAIPGTSAGLVTVKTIDSQIFALDAATGQQRWNYALDTPSLILRAGSTPQIANNLIVVGFANGKLAVLNASNGNMVWQGTIASSTGLSVLQQMVDIDTDPIVKDASIYVTTYQGQLANLRLQTGDLIWQRDMSSYTGMVLTANTLYISDAEGIIWAINSDDGSIRWKQAAFTRRQITGPTLQGSYLVIGDKQGNLYWLSQQDGHIMAKEQPSKNIAFFAPPISNGNTVYAINQKGTLYAYDLTGK